MKDEPGKLRLDLDADDLRSLLVLLAQSQASAFPALSLVVIASGSSATMPKGAHFRSACTA